MGILLEALRTQNRHVPLAVFAVPAVFRTCGGEKPQEPQKPQAANSKIEVCDAPFQPLPWWRDSAEISARFDERAGWFEFDQNMPRVEAEEAACDSLAKELHDCGLDHQEASLAVASLKENAI